MNQESDPLEGQFTYDIQLAEKLCLIVAEGDINFKTSLNALNSMANAPGFEKDFNILADLRYINYHPSYQEVLALHKKMVFLKANFQGKIALVTTSFFWVVAELLCKLSKPHGYNISAFTNIEKAKAWINEVPDLNMITD